MGRLVRFPVERRLLDRAQDTSENTAPAGVCVRLRPAETPDGFSATFAASALDGLQRASYEVVDGGVEVTWSPIEGGAAG